MVVITAGIAVRSNYNFMVVPKFFCELYSDLVSCFRIRFAGSKRLISVKCKYPIGLIVVKLRLSELFLCLFKIDIQRCDKFTLLGFHIVRSIFDHVIDHMKISHTFCVRFNGLFGISRIVDNLIKAILNAPDSGHCHIYSA